MDKTISRVDIEGHYKLCKWAEKGHSKDIASLCSCLEYRDTHGQGTLFSWWGSEHAAGIKVNSFYVKILDSRF